MKIPQKHLQDLLKLLSSPKDEKEMHMLLDDLLTPKELSAIAERWQLVQLLAAGATQRDIAKKLGLAISTVTRGSRQLQFGSGGFKKYLTKGK
jgi:Trp operon repressor